MVMATPVAILVPMLEATMATTTATETFAPILEATLEDARAVAIMEQHPAVPTTVPRLVAA